MIAIRLPRFLVVLALGVLLASTASAKTIYVEASTGDDANDGSTRQKAVATLSRAVKLVGGGDLVLVGPGVYFDRPVLESLPSSAQTPIWIRACPLGQATLSGMWKEAATGKAAWKSEGGGVYSASHGPVLFGGFQGTFLFRFQSLSELQQAQASTAAGAVKTPPHGLAVANGNVYVKLPGGADPNGKPVLLSPPTWGEAGAQPVVKVMGSPGLILDGFRIEGSGTYCLSVDQASTGVTVRNTVFAYCRFGALLPDKSLVEWSEYGYPGFHDFSEQLRKLNGAIKTYPLVKEYYPSNWLEGGLADSYGETHSSTGCEFRYNYLHEAFDGETLGHFEYSESHHNVYEYNYDNHVEMEHWTSHGSRNLKLHHSLFLACPGGPLSHQSAAVVGPHWVYRNVVYGLDEHGWGSWTQIKSKMPNATGGVHYYHNLIWGHGGELYWEGEAVQPFHFRNNIFVFTHNSNKPISLDSDYNLLVNDADKPWLHGGNGAYLGSDPATLKLLSVSTLNFGLTPGSPAENKGVSLPGYNDGAAGGPDIGPFEAGENPGGEWPRPRRTQLTTALPDRWKGAPPPAECLPVPGVDGGSAPTSDGGGSQPPSTTEAGGPAPGAESGLPGADPRLGQRPPPEGCNCRLAETGAAPLPVLLLLALMWLSGRCRGWSRPPRRPSPARRPAGRRRRSGPSAPAGR